MKAVLYNYEIFPIVFPCDKEVMMTIRPLGKHAAFCEKSYKILVREMNDHDSPYNHDIEAVTPDEDGCLRFPVVFHTEMEHFIRVLREEKCVAQLSVYSLLPDMACRRPYRGDLHMHSCCSDGQEEPSVVAANYRAKGYDFCGITDHHRYYPSLEAMRTIGAFPTSMKLYPGEEVHLPGTNVHIVNFGGLRSVNGQVMSKQTYQETIGAPEKLALHADPAPALDDEAYNAAIDEIVASLDSSVPEAERRSYAVCKWAFDRIREADGLGIFAHPYWLCYMFNVSDALTHALMENHPFDAFEVLGGETYYQMNGYQTILYYEEWKHGRVHPIVGSTDTHGSTEHNKNSYDVCSTIVFAPMNERRALIDSIKSRYSVAVDTISAEYRLVGEERYQRFGCFLMENWYPLHDKLCEQEGYWLKAAVTGSDDCAADVLKVLAPRMEALFDKFFLTE